MCQSTRSRTQEERNEAIESAEFGEHYRVTRISGYTDPQYCLSLPGKADADGQCLVVTGVSKFGITDQARVAIEFDGDLPLNALAQLLHKAAAAMEGSTGPQLAELAEGDGYYTHAESLEDGSMRLLNYQEEEEGLWEEYCRKRGKRT